MKRPHMPAFMYGTIRVTVPQVNVVLSLVAIVLAYVGIVAEWPLVTAVGLGSLCVMPIYVGCQWLAQWRFNRRVAHWPVSVQVMPGAEGERVAFVTTHDGNVLSLILPDDYDPADDNGRWFMQQVAPELAALMVFEEDEEAE